MDVAPSSTNMLKTKQQKKEEGRRRALEISIAKQQQNTVSNNNNDSECGKGVGGKRGNRKSARHGARNQHRHKQFARWILKTFPHVVEDCSDTIKQDEHSSCKIDTRIYDECIQTQQLHILDVAGGKGELSARLSLCHSLRVVMIDPRPADIKAVYMNDVVPKLPNKWQTSINDRLEQKPSFVHDELDKRFTQLVMPFTSPSHLTTSTDEQKWRRYNNADLDEAVRNASLIIGLHADGATEAIVDAALLYNKPFVVVPCCVFPNLFNQRYITIRNSTANTDADSDTQGEVLMPKENRVPVRTHDQFCEYLLAKDPRFKKEVLPFEGRNVAIWWGGKR